MRMAFVIVSLAGIAAGLVSIRRAQVVVRYDTQMLRVRRLELRRQLWDQQVQLGRLTSPSQLRQRIQRMSLPVSERPGGGRREIGLALTRTGEGDGN